ANPLLTRLEANTQNLDSIIGNAHATLGRLEKGMRDTTVDLARAIDEVAGRAAAAGEEIVGQTSQLERTSSLMTSEMRDFSRHLASQIDQLTQVTGTLGAESTEFGRNVQGMEAAMLQTVRQSVDQLTGVSQEIARVVERTSTDAARQIDQGRVLVTQGLQTVTTEYLDTVAKSRADLMGYLANSSHNIAGAISQATEAVAGNINAASAQFLSGIDQTANNLISELNSTGTGLAGRVEQATGKLFSEMETRAEDLAANLNTTSNRLIGQLESTISTVSGTLNETGQRFQGLIGGSSEDMEARIDGAAERLYGHMNATVASVSGKIDEITSAVYGRLEQTSAGVASQIQSASSSVNDLLVTTGGTIAAHLKETAEIVNRQMQDSGIALASNIENTGGVVTEKLISVSGSFVQNFTRTREELIELIKVNTNMMTERIDTTATDMTNAFAETAVRVTRQVNEANTLMAQRLEKTSAEVTSQLDTASTQIISEIGKASGAFSESLGQTTLQITGRLEQDTGLLVDRVDRAAKELDTVSVTTAVTLDEAHRKFSKHVETANTYLADQLSTAASAIDERLEGISMNLTGKLEMTGSRVSERLDDVTSLVERSIGKFDEEMERILINRKDALDLLIGDAAKRADEVDAVMTSYMKLIEGSLAASEARSKDIGRVVTEQAALAAASLEQEIGKLEASAGGQITQASRVLRDQHERAMTAMNEMLSATATDFQQTAQDMRITAQQVVKDIDVARSEMKRAIVGLPEETRSNADAMRRVVSDQISALNALAEVVKRQTGTLDLSGPGIALQRSYRDSPPGKSEGATVQALQSGTAGAQQKNPGQSETVQGEQSGTALRGRILADLAENTAKIGEPGKAAPKTALLQALPREMENLVDKLNLAARDLVEAIDGNLPRDLEKRFAEGERDVYTGRLYEGRGKRLQKLLIDRYGNDRLVRSRVDASVRLFERLLDMMSAAPQGEAMVDACLASESGRIYVMLAESSGRIAPH
ncbi:MAG: apolipoprotein A1/A4/E family protein, partial [Rhizobiales bacterium]|nr:apolipoprotein A1/A4/E family protein [Hyphomicrobiales bacterium]